MLWMRICPSFAVSSDSVFAEAIAKFYGGRADQRTLDLLAA